MNANYWTFQADKWTRKYWTYDIIIVITKFKAECEFIELEELGSGDVGLLIFNVVTPAVPAVLIVVFLMLF